MSAVKPMNSGPIAPQVDRLYQQGIAFGWVREVYVNALQAGARHIYFTTEWEGVKTSGVHRRVVVDDGYGMTAEELPKFLNAFGGSGKEVTNAANYGYGTKVSLLPWNRHGLVVISRSAEATCMIWMQHDAEAQTYGARLFDVSDEGGIPDFQPVVCLNEWDNYTEEGLDWSAVAKSVLGNRVTGTALILMGNLGTEDTIMGDPRWNEGSKYGINQFLNNRFFNLALLPATMVTYPNIEDRSTWPKSEKGAVRRFHAVGLEDTLNAGTGLVKGEFEIPKSAENPLAVKVFWYMVDDRARSEKSQSSARGDRTGYPVTAAKFDLHPGISEIFELESVGRAGNKSSTAVSGRRISFFIRVPEIANRVGLIFEPIPDAAREEAVYSAGSSRALLNYQTSSGPAPLPWDEWRLAWASRVPKPIQSAIDDHYADIARAGDGKLDPRLTAHLNRTYLPMFQSILTNLFMSRIPKPKSSSSSAPKPKIADSGAKEPRAVRTLHLPAHDDGAPRRPKSGLVEVSFRESSDWYPVMYDPSGHVAVVNRSSGSYKRTVAHIVQKYVESGRLDSESASDPKTVLAIRAIEYAMRIHVQLSVTEMVMEAELHPEEKAALLDDKVVSGCLKGVKAIEVMAADYIKESVSVSAKQIAS